MPYTLLKKIRELAGNAYRIFARYFPLRPGGVIFLLACAAGFYFLAFKELDIVFAFMTTTGIAVFFVVFFWNLAAFVILRSSIRGIIDPTRQSLVVGTPMRGDFSLSKKYFWAPLTEIDRKIVYPEHIETELGTIGKEYIEILTPRRRGLFEQIIREFEVRDVLGFFVFRFRKTYRKKLRIDPAMPAINEVQNMISLISGDDISHPFGEPQGDPMDIRRYASGDPQRMILWKIYARTRKLFVRVPENAFSTRRRTGLYLVSGRGDEKSASLARAIISGGLIGDDWIFGADGSPDFARDKRQALEIIAKSGGSQSFDPVNFKNFKMFCFQNECRSAMVLLPADSSEILSNSGVFKQGGLDLLLIAPFAAERRYAKRPPFFDIFFRRKKSGDEPSIKDMAANYRPFDSGLFYYDINSGAVYDKRKLEKAIDDKKIAK